MKSKKVLFLVFFLAILLPSYGQYEMVIDAYVFNQDTKKTVSHANVGFIDKGVGTVSDENGKFYLRYDEDEISDDDIIQFSGVGYEPIKFTHKQLFKILNTNNKIFLKPLSNDHSDQLGAAIVARRLDSIGYITYDSNMMAYWSDNNALGSEIGAFIKSRKKNAQLENIRFNIIENTADSLVVRVNIYKNNKGKPGENIVMDNILHTISRKKGEERIDLSDYNISVNQDFIASIELVKVYGENFRFAITGSRIGHSFIKNGSQNSWISKEDAGIAFKMHIKIPLPSYTVDMYEKPKHITLYWDTSLSMKDKNIDEEIAFLEAYFLELNTAHVDLVTFSNSTAKIKSFIIDNGVGNTLINEIKNIKYNGATNFSTLFNEKNIPNQYLVFTDGYYNYGKPKFEYNDIPVFYISSKITANHKELQQSAYFTGGMYINLLKTNPSVAIDNIFDTTKNDFVYDFDTSSEFIKGTVAFKGKPIQGCRVLVKETMKHSETNADGVFYIQAKKGDVLMFDHFGFKSKDVLVEDNNKDVNIELKPKYNMLGEVRFEDAKEHVEPEVKMGGIKKNKRKIGFANYTIAKKDFPDAAIYLPDLIRFQFPAVKVISPIRNLDNTVYLARRGRSIETSTDILFVVNGIPLDRAPNFLMVDMIENITYTPGIAGASRYGTLGRNGVFYITTNMDQSILGKREEKENTLLITDNEYKEASIQLMQQNNRPKHLETLWASTTYEEAVDQYYQLRENHIHDTKFYLYCFEYFKYRNIDFSKEILSNLAEIRDSDYGTLRALAFRLEALGEKKDAMLIYKRIFEIKPDYAQSYLDLARIYKDNKQYQKAFDIYKIMLQDKERVVDFKEVKPQVVSQLQHLLNLNRIEVSYTDVPRDFLVVKSAPVRIVFDWNDPKAKFDLQFVNPKNKFYEWHNQLHQNKQLTPKDKGYGALSKEFVLDNSLQGNWIVNLEADRNLSIYDNVFLKYTIYRNYGLSNETKEVKFIKLYNQKEKVTLDTFSI